jgi:hypothetical protein
MAPVGAGIGAAIGFATTAILFEGSGRYLFGTFLFIVPGAAIGGLIGSSIERWQTVYESETSSVIIPTTDPKEADAEGESKPVDEP